MILISILYALFCVSVRFRASWFRRRRASTFSEHPAMIMSRNPESAGWRVSVARPRDGRLHPRKPGQRAYPRDVW